MADEDGRARPQLRQRPVDCALPGIAPVLARVLGARVSSPEALAIDWSALIPPARLKGMDRAVAAVLRTLDMAGRFLIVADYDADGATSAALLKRALHALGAQTVDVLVPDRFRHDYGLTPPIVELAYARRPDLLVTVDQGIASFEGIDLARRLGMTVLVTDHHLCGDHLPAASAIVNPNQPGDDSGAGSLAGVGVALYLSLAVRAALKARGDPVPTFGPLLDLVALGTIADVVPLDRNNRILVAAGLRRITDGNASPGVAALLEVAGKSARVLSPADLAYAIAPRLNAAGRVDHMQIGIDCLLAPDLATARPLAATLDRLNRERRVIERATEASALATLPVLGQADGAALPFGIALAGDNWHQGVIGIIAGRLKDRYGRPVVVFAEVAPGELKGSGRSIAGFHLRDALHEVSVREPGLLTRFGGHAMAAGLRMASADFGRFQAAFDAVAREHLTPADLEPVIWTDGELAPDQVTLDMAQALAQAGPWGAGFPEPVFEGVFGVAGQKRVGEHHLALSLTPANGHPPVDAIAFRQPPIASPQVRIAYRLTADHFRERTRLRLVVEHLEEVSLARADALSCQAPETV